jgi:hypothetical protein
MFRVSIRRLSIYNFVWGPLKATKTVYLIPQKWKKNKDTYGIYPTKFASSTQKHKKVIETSNQPIEIKKKISKKRMFSTSKVKRRQKFVWGLPDSTQNPKKIIETPNQPIKTKTFPKKLCLVLVPKSVKEPKIRMGATGRNLQAPCTKSILSLLS